MLLFLVCFCGRKVKEAFHYPKQVLDLPISDPSLMRRRRRKSDSDDEYNCPRYTVRVKKKGAPSWTDKVFKTNREASNSADSSKVATAVEMEPLFGAQEMIMDPRALEGSLNPGNSDDIERSVTPVPSCSGYQLVNGGAAEASRRGADGDHHGADGAGQDDGHNVRECSGSSTEDNAIHDSDSDLQSDDVEAKNQQQQRSQRSQRSQSFNLARSEST